MKNNEHVTSSQDVTKGRNLAFSTLAHSSLEPPASGMNNHTTPFSAGSIHMQNTIDSQELKAVQDANHPNHSQPEKEILTGFLESTLSADVPKIETLTTEAANLEALPVSIAVTPAVNSQKYRFVRKNYQTQPDTQVESVNSQSIQTSIRNTSITKAADNPQNVEIEVADYGAFKSIQSPKQYKTTESNQMNSIEYQITQSNEIQKTPLSGEFSMQSAQSPKQDQIPLRAFLENKAEQPGGMYSSPGDSSIYTNTTNANQEGSTRNHEDRPEDLKQFLSNAAKRDQEAQFKGSQVSTMRDLVEFNPQEDPERKLNHGGNSGAHLPTSPFNQYLAFNLKINSTPQQSRSVLAQSHLEMQREALVYEQKKMHENMRKISEYSQQLDASVQHSENHCTLNSQIQNQRSRTSFKGEQYRTNSHSHSPLSGSPKCIQPYSASNARQNPCPLPRPDSMDKSEAKMQNQTMPLRASIKEEEAMLDQGKLGGQQRIQIAKQPSSFVRHLHRKMVLSGRQVPQYEDESAQESKNETSQLKFGQSITNSAAFSKEYIRDVQKMELRGGYIKKERMASASPIQRSTLTSKIIQQENNSARKSIEELKKYAIGKLTGRFKKQDQSEVVQIEKNKSKFKSLTPEKRNARRNRFVEDPKNRANNNDHAQLADQSENERRHSNKRSTISAGRRSSQDARCQPNDAFDEIEKPVQKKDEKPRFSSYQAYKRFREQKAHQENEQPNVKQFYPRKDVQSNYENPYQQLDSQTQMKVSGKQSVQPILRPVIANADRFDYDNPINLRPSDYKPQILNESQRQIAVGMITENESVGTYPSDQHYFYQLAGEMEERKRSINSHFQDSAQQEKRFLQASEVSLDPALKRSRRDMKKTPSLMEAQVHKPEVDLIRHGSVTLEPQLTSKRRIKKKREGMKRSKTKELTVAQSSLVNDVSTDVANLCMANISSRLSDEETFTIQTQNLNHESRGNMVVSEMQLRKRDLNASSVPSSTGKFTVDTHRQLKNLLKMQRLHGKVLKNLLREDKQRHTSSVEAQNLDNNSQAVQNTAIVLVNQMQDVMAQVVSIQSQLSKERRRYKKKKRQERAAETTISMQTGQISMQTGQTTAQNIPILSPYSHIEQEQQMNLNDSGMIQQEESRVLNTQRVEKMKNYQEQLMQDVNVPQESINYEVEPPLIVEQPNYTEYSERNQEGSQYHEYQSKFQQEEAAEHEKFIENEEYQEYDDTLKFGQTQQYLVENKQAQEFCNAVQFEVDKIKNESLQQIQNVKVFYEQQFQEMRGQLQQQIHQEGNRSQVHNPQETRNNSTAGSMDHRLMTFNQQHANMMSFNNLNSEEVDHGNSQFSGNIDTLNRNSIAQQNQQIYEELKQVKAERDRYHEKLLRVRDKVIAVTSNSKPWNNRESDHSPMSPMDTISNNSRGNSKSRTNREPSNCQRSSEYSVQYVNGNIKYQKQNEVRSAGPNSTSQFPHFIEHPSRDSEEQFTAECDSEILSQVREIPVRDRKRTHQSTHEDEQASSKDGNLIKCDSVQQHHIERQRSSQMSQQLTAVIKAKNDSQLSYQSPAFGQQTQSSINQIQCCACVAKKEKRKELVAQLCSDREIPTDSETHKSVSLHNLSQEQTADEYTTFPESDASINVREIDIAMRINKIENYLRARRSAQNSVN